MTHASLGYVCATYPLNYEQSLPPIAKPTPLTEVTPAKKITFYRSGHPRQSGVKMAVNKRAFKTFDALLDDLSQKVSLPFGVRTITTPRGVHSISTLEQLEDGGSYLCSDKKSIKHAITNAAVRKPASQQGPPPASALRRSTLTARQDEGPSHHIHKGPKKITMIKNGDADIRHSIIMNKRNVQNFRNFLDDISELMQYNVRKLYTLEGKKINNLQALFHCPSVLVCVGHEAFKPITYENFRKNPSEKLPDLSMRSRVSIASESFDSKKNANFGLEAKKSVIHPRSPSRSPRISLSSDKSYPNGLNMSSGNNGYASFMDSCPHEKNREFAQTLTDNDIEKRVHVNKDGSLTVEMKVRFHLLNDETLQWSTQIRRFSLPRKNSFNRSCSSEDQGMENVEQINPNNDSEIDEPFCSSETDDSYISKLNEAEHAENHCQNCCNHCQEYDIWKNPIDVEKPQGEETQNVSQARSSCSTTSSCRRITQKKESDGSVRTTSSEEYTQHIVQQAVCYSKSGENGDGSRMRYSSLRRCRSQNSSSVSVSDMGRNHERRESTASRHRASPQPSTGCSHQDNEVFQEPTNKQTFVNVSPSPSIANSKKNSAVKMTDTSTPSPTGPSTSSRKPESTAEEDRPVGKISKSSAGSKQTEGEESSEERAHSAASSCSSHVAKDSNQSVGCNHLPSKPISAASSCPCQTSRKASAMDNVLDTEEVCSVGSNCSHNSGNNLQEAISEDGRPKSEMSLSSGRSKTGKQVKEDFSESEKQSSQGSSCCEMVGSHPELHVQDSNSNDRPISSNSRSSKHSKKSKRCKVKKDLDIDDTSVATSFSSVLPVAQNPALSLAPEEDGRPCSNASCSEASNRKNKVKLTFQQPPCSTYSEPPSLSENKELNVANSDNESPRPSSNESESCPNSKRNKNRMTKSEAESRPSTSTSCNSKADPNVCADQQENNQDQRPVSSASGLSELVQEENSIKIESTGSEKASSICSSVSKASKSKIESTQVKDASEETNVATVELSLATGDEDAAAVIDSALGQRMQQPSPPKGKPGGKNVRQLIKSSSQKSGSSTGTCSVVAEEVTDEKPPESKLDVSGSKSNLSEKSSSVNSYKTDERINHKSVSEKTSERGSRKTTCKHGYQIKKDSDENHTNVDACEKDDFIPSELPNASLEEVVQKWLQKIPLENLLGTCDSLEEFTARHEKPETNVMAEGTKPEVEEATITADKSEEEATVSEREPTEKNDLEAAKLEDDGSSNADNNDTMRDVVETSQAKPVNSDLRVTAKPDNPQNRDLPNNAHSSIQIMKVLLCPKQGTKLDRSNSLPELSSEPEKKLSLSAKSLLTCLGNLQLFDEESLHSKDKSPNSNNSRYEELLGILQSLWLTGIADGDENKAPPMAGNHSKPFKVHNSVDHDITPMTSSGVDVNSGSGESNINGTVNTSLSTEKINCDSALKTCSVIDENSTEIKQPHLVKSSLEEKSDVCCKLNEKDEQYSTSSTLMSNGCCRTQTLKSCENSQNQSQENIIGNRSETLQSDAVSSSNVTPDIAYRVQWSSGGKIINNAGPGENSKSDTAEKPQDTMQNIKGQADPSTDRMEIFDRESCTIQEIIHQSETTNHNRPEDVNDPEEEKNMDNKITEQCDNVDGKESPEQIGTEKECTVQNPAEEKESVPSQKISPDPDPAWVMKLLKKIEKEFIAHYVDAMNDFKIRWNLDNNDTLDQMIADLREEVRSRIQTSIKKELKKVQGRAGKKVPRPPQDQIRHESSEQTDQRRRRLRTMFKQSNYDDNKMNKTPADDKATSKKNNYEQSTGNTSSLISDRNLNFTPTIGDDTEVNEELSIDEFCPCESCTEKSKASKPETNPVQSFAPVNKAFDLQEILKMNKGSKNVEKNGSDAGEMLDGVSNKQNSAERDSFGCVQNKDNTEFKIEDGDNTEVKTEDEKQMEDKMGDEENVEVKPKDGKNEEDKTGDGENLEVKTEEKENVELKTEDGENAKDKTEDGEKVEETTEDEENTEAETEGVVQDDESVTENQENLHNEDSSHGSDETSHQDEAEEAKGDLDQDSSLQDIDEEQNLVEQCADEIESLSGKSEGSVNIKADDAKELTEETHNSICKHELQPQEDDDHSEGISECSECEAENMKHATEEHTTTPEANGEQKKHSEDNNPLLEDDSDTMDMDNSQDNAKEIIGSNVREIDAFENLDEVSELSDEYVESNFVKNQDEEEVEDVGVDGKITTKHSPSPDSSSQVQAAEVQRDSAMEASNGDCIQVKSGEDVNSIPDKTVPRATQMYPESSSDDESETKCNSPEEPANQKDGNDTESDKVSPVNKSKQAVNGGFDEEDLDF